MASIEELVSAIDLAAEGYVPAQETLEVLDRNTLVTLVGPFAVGKTCIIRGLNESYDEFGRTNGFTTRPIRPKEHHDEYRFLPHNEETLEGILGDIEQGKLVQFAVHPTTRYVYGTDVKGYKTKFSVIDSLASSHDDLAAIPFAGMVNIGVVTTPKEWYRRVAIRAEEDTADDINKRIAEAVFSLEWLLDQGSDFSWVVNRNARFYQALEDVHGLATGELDPNPLNRIIGEQLLKAVKENSNLATTVV